MSKDKVAAKENVTVVLSDKDGNIKGIVKGRILSLMQAI